MVAFGGSGIRQEQFRCGCLGYAAPMGVPWLILPTFNEAENIDRIVRAADAVLADASPAGHRILVVDDSSPDGTGRIADGLATELGTVEVLHRARRQGLGP